MGIDTNKNARFSMESSDLHNSPFMRVWLKTDITMRFALKTNVDSIGQTSKSSSDDPFHEDIIFLTSIITSL